MPNEIPKPNKGKEGFFATVINMIIKNKANKIARQYYKDGRIQKVALDLTQNIERMKQLTDEYCKKYGC